MNRVISLFVVGAFIGLIFTPLSTRAVSVYWNPELYEDNLVLPYGDSIERDYDYAFIICAMIRSISEGVSVDGMNIRLRILDVGDVVIHDDIQVTSNYTETQPTLYYAIYEFEDGEIPVGEYELAFSCFTPSGYYNSTYDLVVSTGSKFEVPHVSSVTFLRNSIEINEEVSCVVDLTKNVTYVEFITEGFGLSLVYSSGLWKGDVVFTEDGEIDFAINVLDEYNLVFNFNYTVYVAERSVETYIPNVRVIDNGDDSYTTITKSKVWFISSVYKEASTFHLILETSNNVVVDMTFAEPSSVKRKFLFYEYDTNELQVIVSGVTEGVGITYVLDDMGLEIKRLFGDIKIKGVNDWRNLWGLLDDSKILNTRESLVGAGVFNINYDNSFGFFTSERTLVVRY